MTVYILRGYSGAGKSTYVKFTLPHAIRASRDTIRATLSGRSDKFVGTHQFENMVTSVQENIVRSAIKQDKDVVIDDTNLTKKFAMRWVNLASRLGVPFRVVNIETPVDVCLERNSQRPDSVPSKVIETQAKKFPIGSWPVLEPTEGVRPETFKPYNGTPGKPNAIVVDIDNTVAMLPEGYSPYDPEHYPLDIPNRKVFDIVADLALAKDAEIIFLSGRGEQHREATGGWLAKHFIKYNPLFMRPEGDSRPDYIVKDELFETYVAPNYNVLYCIDDRRCVVDMYRSKGLLVLDVAGGDF